MESKINILLVEDNRADAQLINIYLKESYSNLFTLSIADSLSKGLNLVATSNYNVIIIDLSLPDSAGIDTFKDVYAASSEIPIIVLTGNEDELVGINTVKLGAQDFLIKGKLDSKILKRSLDYSIERYKLLKSLSENTADLLQEKYKLAQAQKLAHVGSWEWNVKEKTFTCSDELFRILGFDPDKESLTYQEFLDAVHPDEREFVTAMIEESVNKLEPFDFSHRIIRQDGATRSLHSKGELMLDKDGNILKIIGTEQDITERKKEQQEQLAMVAIKSYNAVTIADSEGKIEWVNAGFTKLFGYKLEDVKGTYGEILRRGEKTGLSPDADLYKTILSEKKPVSYENKNYSKDGKEYWVLTSLTPILNEKGEVEKIISIDSDITRQKKAEQELIISNKIAEHSLYKGNKALEELHKAKKQLEESLKVKEQFLANMSHEIRTPMNAIIGFTNLLLKQEFIKENKQYLHAIKTSGENLLVIINDILDFSKLESGKITFESISFKLPQLISMLIELMFPKAIEKSIQLSAEIDKNIPTNLIGDPTRLNQILLNLVGNAIKFTEDGEVEIKVALLTESKDDVELQFTITDTGIGIPPESLAKIFEGFTQASNDTTRKFGGTGLGLTITKQLVELQKGTISVSSGVHEGSVFSFNLKFKKDKQPDNVDVCADKNNTDKFPLKDVRVLLVEDNFFNQMLAAKILDNWKCIVEIAGNGKIAIEKVKEHAFDIILMDIQLPEMDGYEATNYIRNKLQAPKNTTPIIAMTAHAFADEVEKCLKAGMNDYISKPFDENKLYAKILKILEKEKQHLDQNNCALEEDTNRNKKNVNLSYLEKVSNGDDEFVLKMISIFLDQTPMLLYAIKDSIENKKFKSVKEVLHKMMPSVVFMGLKELEALITVMDKFINEESSLDQLPQLYKKVELICNETILELEAEKQKREK